MYKQISVLSNLSRKHQVELKGGEYRASFKVESKIYQHIVAKPEAVPFLTQTPEESDSML